MSSSSKNWGFCDLSLSKSYDFSKLEMLKELGFDTLAINTHVEEEEPSDEPRMKKKKKGENKEKKDYIPPPVEISKDIRRDDYLYVLQRVTIEFSDSSIAHKLNQSENLKKYDIVAVLPKTLQAFQYACSNMDVDLITFDPESRLPFKISRKLYKQAIDRRMFFELMYSQAITDPTSRKNIINTAHTYHAVGISHNIVVTSGAETYMQVRDVHDVINLGFILGLTPNQSLEVVRNNARRLMLRSEARKCRKLFMNVSTCDENKDKNKDTTKDTN